MEWTAETPDGVATWRDGALSGDPSALRTIETELFGDDLIAVTPTGPFVARDTGDELAVLAALIARYPRGLVLSGALPDLNFDAPEGADF